MSSDPDDFIFDEDLPPRSARRGARGGASVSRHPRILDAEHRAQLREQLAHVQAQVDEIAGAEMTTSQRIERLLGVNSTIIMSLLREALGEDPDVDRSNVLSRALVAVKDTVGILKSKHDLESVDSFNARSPKFAIVFGWFIELVHRVLALHVNETQSANFFNDLVAELSGWEDRIERQFKGISGRALASLQSPFVESFREQLSETTAREAYLERLNSQIERAERRLALIEDERQQIAIEGPAGSI